MTQEPASYAGRTKYTAERSRRYQDRPVGKHRAEMELLERAFALIPQTHRVLDAPCGGGRVSVHLSRQGYRMTAADLSEAMVAIARETMAGQQLDVAVDRQDLEAMTHPDRAFDTIVSFRLFHHFPATDIRQRVVRELCRVAAHNVVLSYFSPWSFTSAKNRLLAALGGKPVKKFATSLSEVKRYFDGCGFRFVADFAQLPLIHTLHVAVFERREEPTP